MADRSFDFEGSLPTFRPDPALWARIVRTQHRRRVRRRWTGAGLAAAAVAVIAVATSLVAPRPQDADRAWTAQDESRALELEWRRLAAAGSQMAGTARVRAIDAALQIAYDRGARDEETAALWQQRNRALRTLIATVHDATTVGHEPTRI